MASIIGLKEKQAALKDIQLFLRSLAPLNAFIAAENPQNEYVVTFDTHKATLKCEDKEKINDLVRAHKKVVVDRIEDMAKKYDIELDEEDRALMKID